MKFTTIPNSPRTCQREEAGGRKRGEAQDGRATQRAWKTVTATHAFIQTPTGHPRVRGAVLEAEDSEGQDDRVLAPGELAFARGRQALSNTTHCDFRWW